MSRQSIESAVTRILGTAEASPLAVFARCGKEDVDVVFANTAKTRHEILCDDPTLIGVFWRGTADEARYKMRRKLKLPFDNPQAHLET